MAEEWGQVSSITHHLASIIREYPDGTSLLYELCQNADDAGAKVIKFCLDHRVCQSRLMKSMDEWMGPALVVYNDAKFTDKDFKNMQNVACGGKSTDTTKTGRFGIGFNSVYHLTDVPSFLSGEWLAFSDPHKKYANPGSPGIRYPIASLLKHAEDTRIYNVFNELSANTKTYEGTLFRFPLRSKKAAGQSEIKKVESSVAHIKQYFADLKEAGSEIMLFLRHIERIEVLEIDKNGKIAELFALGFANASLKELRTARAGVMGSLARFSINSVPEETVFCAVIEQFETGKLVSEDSWIVSQIVGGAKANKFCFQDKALGLRPTAGCAIRLESAKKNGGQQSRAFVGRAFCSLPLPITTQLPFHINGFFDMPSNRRQINVETHEGKHNHGTMWNSILAFDVIPHTIVELLMSVRKKAFMDISRYIELFPTLTNTSAYFKSIIVNFYTLAWSCDFFFCQRANKWVVGASACFIDSYSFADIAAGDFGGIDLSGTVALDDSDSVYTVKRQLLPLLSMLLEAQGLFLVEFNPKIVDDLLTLNSTAIKVSKATNVLSPQLLRNIVRQIGAKKLKAVLSAFVADASNSSNNSNNAHSTLAQPTKKSTATNGKKNGKANLTELAGMDVEIGARTGVMQALDPSHARLVDNVNLLMRYVYSDLSSKSAQHIKASLVGLPLFLDNSFNLHDLSKSLYLPPDEITTQLCQGFIDDMILWQQIDGDQTGFFANKKLHPTLRLRSLTPHEVERELAGTKQFKTIHHLNSPTVAWNKTVLTEDWLRLFWRYAEANKTAWKDFEHWCLIPTQHSRTLVALAHASSVVNLASYFRNTGANRGGARATQSAANGAASLDECELLSQVMIEIGCLLFDSGFSESLNSVISPKLALCNAAGLTNALSASTADLALLSDEKKQLVLKFIARNDPASLDENQRAKLRQFPLWKNIQSRFVTLGQTKAVVLRQTHSSQQFHLELLEGVQCIVLAPQQDGRLQQLYRDFEIPEISASELIEKLLIPHLSDLVTACEKKKLDKPIEEVEQILRTICSNFSEEFVEPLKAINFVFTGKAYKTAASLLDPQDKLLSYLFAENGDGSSLFPTKECVVPREVLLSCGLQNTAPERVTLQLILFCAQRLDQLGKKKILKGLDTLMDIAVQVALMLQKNLSFVERLPRETIDIVKQFTALSFIPLKAPVVREGKDCVFKSTKTFYSLQEFGSFGSKELLEHIKPILSEKYCDFFDEYCLTYLGVPTPTPAEVMKNMLLALSNKIYSSSLMLMLQQLDFLVKDPQWGGEATRIIQRIRDENIPCFYLATIQGKDHKEVYPISLYNCEFSCMPIVFRATNSMRSLSSLMKILQVPKQPNCRMIYEGMKRYHEKKKLTVLDFSEIKNYTLLLDKLLEVVLKARAKKRDKERQQLQSLSQSQNNSQSQSHALVIDDGEDEEPVEANGLDESVIALDKITIPDVRGVLRPASDIVVIDAQWLNERISGKAPFHRSHPDLNQATLLALGMARLTQAISEVLPAKFVPKIAADRVLEGKMYTAAIQTVQFAEGLQRLYKDKRLESLRPTKSERELLAALKVEIVESLPLSLYYKGQDVTAENVPGGTEYYDAKRRVIYLCSGNTNFALVKKLSDRIVIVLDSVSNDDYLEHSLDQSCLTEILRESLSPSFTPNRIHEFLNFSGVIDIPNRKISEEEKEANKEIDMDADTEDQQLLNLMNASKPKAPVLPPVDTSKGKAQPQQGKKRTQAEINREKAEEEANKKRRLEAEKERQREREKELALAMPTFANDDRIEIEQEPPMPIFPDENKENNTVGNPVRPQRGKRGAKDNGMVVDQPSSTTGWGKGTATSMQKDLNSQIQAAITSSNDHTPYTGSLYESPETTRITHNCEHVDEKQLVRVGDMNDGELVVYLHKGLTRFDESQLCQFAGLLGVLCEMFSLKLNATRIFVENSDTIAYNSNSTLFFNYYYFLKLGLPEEEVLAFWFMVFCHEIAHNVHVPHDANHEGVMEWLATRYMKRLFVVETSVNLREEAQRFVFNRDGQLRKASPPQRPKRTFEPMTAQRPSAGGRRIANSNNNNNSNASLPGRLLEDEPSRSDLEEMEVERSTVGTRASRAAARANARNAPTPQATIPDNNSAGNTVLRISRSSNSNPRANPPPNSRHTKISATNNNSASSSQSILLDLCDSED